MELPSRDGEGVFLFVRTETTPQLVKADRSDRSRREAVT